MLLTPQISYGAKGTIHFWILVLAVLLVETMLFIHTYQLITMTQMGEKYLHNCFLELLRFAFPLPLPLECLGLSNKN